ncbi:hypothetical protein KDH83_31450, partial [Achromobacter sp. Marseille-Q0513]|uniref:hypothetical protein n=1 Tax=Achromobacter sp. Marseille-Q0513 TaxID=2829161 RepID=UPI001B8DDFCF
IPQGMVPNYPGQFSAFGFIMTDARVDRHRTVQQVSRRFEGARVSTAMRDLVADAVGELRDQGYTQGIEVYRSVEARYLGQNHELEVVVDGDDFDGAAADALWSRFHEQHEARFGFAIPGETIEMVNLKVIVVAVSGKPALREVPKGQGSPAPSGRRRVRMD